MYQGYLRHTAHEQLVFYHPFVVGVNRVFFFVSPPFSHFPVLKVTTTPSTYRNYCGKLRRRAEIILPRWLQLVETGNTLKNLRKKLQIMMVIPLLQPKVDLPAYQVTKISRFEYRWYFEPHFPPGIYVLKLHQSQDLKYTQWKYIYGYYYT